MCRIRTSESAIINASTQLVYDLLADYVKGHPRLLPKQYFSDLRVEQGGVGAGTIISFKLHVGGQTRIYRGSVTTPEPGRLIVESYAQAATVTTFTFTPQGEQQCKLEIATAFETSSGVRDLFERLLTPLALKRVYREELKLINKVAQQEFAIK